MAKLLTIGEVARSAGMLPTTLRYYESIGLLPVPVRENGHRRYDTDIFQRLEMIETAQQAGFTLAEVRVLFEEILASTSPAAKWHSLIQHKLHEMNIMLTKIQSMKNLLEDILQCDDGNLADCIYFTGQKHKSYK